MNIKESNYYMLKDFATDHCRRPEVQGTKLRAIYKLIQSKGEPIKSERKDLDGAKAIEIAKGEYLSMIRIAVGATRDSHFYPCAIRTILLTELTTKP